MLFFRTLFPPWTILPKRILCCFLGGFSLEGLQNGLSKGPSPTVDGILAWARANVSQVVIPVQENVKSCPFVFSDGTYYPLESIKSSSSVFVPLKTVFSQVISISNK